MVAYPTPMFNFSILEYCFRRMALGGLLVLVRQMQDIGVGGQFLNGMPSGILTVYQNSILKEYFEDIQVVACSSKINAVISEAIHILPVETSL